MLNRNMLSSAHVLAMDTKNLLDVCDSIRARYPDVVYQLPDPNISPSVELPQMHQSPKKQQNLVQQQPQDVQQDFYENVVKSDKVEITEQLYSNQNLPHSEIGIYDNNSIIQEQLRIVEEPLMSPNATNGVEAK